MNSSMQSASGRHLAPATPEFPFRVLIWERRSLLDVWVLAEVFDMATFAEAETEALEVCTEPYADGVTAMHYVIGEVTDPDDDDDMFDGDESEPEEVDHQAARWDHDRDHRKHAS